MSLSHKCTRVSLKRVPRITKVLFHYRNITSFEHLWRNYFTIKMLVVIIYYRSRTWRTILHNIPLCYRKDVYYENNTRTVFYLIIFLSLMFWDKKYFIVMRSLQFHYFLFLTPWQETTLIPLYCWLKQYPKT